MQALIEAKADFQKQRQHFRSAQLRWRGLRQGGGVLLESQSGGVLRLRTQQAVPPHAPETIGHFLSGTAHILTVPMSWTSGLGAGDMKGNVSFTKPKFLGETQRLAKREWKTQLSTVLPNPYITQAVWSVHRDVFKLGAYPHYQPCN